MVASLIYIKLDIWSSRFIDAFLNIDNPIIEVVVNHIYQPELHLNNLNASDTEVTFFNFHLTISNVHSQFMKRLMTFFCDYFISFFFFFLDDAVSRFTNQGNYISQHQMFSFNIL